MPRPELDNKYLAELEARADRLVNNPPDDLKFVLSLSNANGYFREIFMSGEWLSDELTKLGLSGQQQNDICFANGQRCFGQKDVWAIAQQSLEKARAGKPDEPGPILAEQIMRELQ